MESKDISWPSACVAVALVLLVTGITITAIIRYDVDSVLKIWSSLGTIVGIITGTAATYFFTRQTIDRLERELDRERTVPKH